MDSIKEEIKSGNFVKALDSLISLVQEENFTSLPHILEGILEIQEKGYDLTKEQLQKVKQFVDTYDDTVQELAMKVYSTAIIRNINLIKNEIDFVNSKLKAFEPIVRDKIIDFLIKVFSDFSTYEKQLIRGLLTYIRDDSWNLRMKVIEFLNDIFLERPNLINEFDKELEGLLDEKDIDVSREGLDFLLKFYVKTYTAEDLKNLIISIPERDWIAQEKILFLIGKLGIKRKDLIKPIIRDLVYLLDYDDYLVNKKASQTIEEIMEYHVDLFDDVFLSFIQNDEIDNLEAIEKLLSESIVKHGYERFKTIFEFISPKDESYIKSFNNVIKKLYTADHKLIESLFFQLINDLLKDLSILNYVKLKMILELNHQYNIYLICYQALNNRGELEHSEEEERRIDLINFLHKVMPELSFQKLNVWLDSKLKQGPVSLDDLCENFHINRSQLIEILTRLVQKGLLTTTISNDTIKPKKSKPEPNNDILFFKQLKVIRRPEEIEYKINVAIRIKNMSGKNITNINVILNYPQNLLIEQEDKKEDKKIPDAIDPNQEFILSWLFQRYYDKEINPTTTSSIKFVMIYEKDSKIFSIKKKMDLFLV